MFYVILMEKILKFMTKVTSKNIIP